MGFVEEYVRHVRGSHGSLRTLLAGLDEDALNWTPGPETNSVAVLVTHLLESEAEVLRLSADTTGTRDRAAEFRVSVSDPAELLALVDRVDALLADLTPAITDERLDAVWLKPSAQRIKTPQTSLFWLVNNYGHMREHLAHLELTLQLYRQAR